MAFAFGGLEGGNPPGQASIAMLHSVVCCVLCADASVVLLDPAVPASTLVVHVVVHQLESVQSTIEPWLARPKEALRPAIVIRACVVLRLSDKNGASACMTARELKFVQES